MVKISAEVRGRLAEKMAGEITLSDKPGETLKKWRVNFEVSQSDLAAYLSISPSVISDYESGRRKSPGILIISKIVDSLLDIDEQRGYVKTKAYESLFKGGILANAVYDIHEYLAPLSVTELIKSIEGSVVYTPGVDFEKKLYGYTIVDGLNAILDLSSNEFQRLYGWSTERAMIFTNITTGRSPMVALRVTSLKPAAVVLHGLEEEKVDQLAIKIAELERIPLIVTTMDLSLLIRTLQEQQ
jgi:putative transcriptional regulator